VHDREHRRLELVPQGAGSLSRGVMPVERPTVLSAEIASNARPRKGSSGSESESAKITSNAAARYSRNTLIAVRTTRRGIERPCASTDSWPTSIARSVCNSTPKVTVFTPPPVETGPAPTTIRNISRRSVASRKLPIGTVSKPAVRGVTDWKQLARKLVSGWSRSACSRSSTQKPTKPSSSRNAVTRSESFACRLSRIGMRPECRRRNSAKLRK
jgi:hypothetical protein